MTDRGLSALRAHLAVIPPGQITNRGELVSLLADCWDTLEGSNKQGMTADKLYGRVEDLHWEPPVLSFRIERHGGTVHGSVYAEMQGWSVNIEEGSAVCGLSGRRVVGKKQPPMKVEPLAKELTELISVGEDDPRLKWYGTSRVRILIGIVIPQDSAVKQTIAGRRKRLARALEESLRGRGWNKVPGVAAHTYEQLNPPRTT